MHRLANPLSWRRGDREEPLVVSEKRAQADRGQGFVEYFACSDHLRTRCIRS